MLLRFLIFLLFFYLVYFLVKNIFFKPFRQGYNQSPNQNGQGHHNPFKREKEGDVSISYSPNNKERKDRQDVGEYVDYEEVDDKD